MRWLVLTGLFFFRCSLLWAQEREVVSRTMRDTVGMEMAGRFEPVLEFPGSVLPFIFSPCLMPLMEVPEFDFTPWLRSRWKVDYAAGRNEFQYNGISPFLLQGGYGGWPAFYGTILNQATYRLSDKFLLGGNSFGVGALWTSPLRKPGSNQWEWRGASMFLQYKVSKNFRIETHVSVSGNQFSP